MPRVLSTALVAMLFTVGVASCGGGGGPDIAGDVCKRADTCQFLSGISAAQCKDVVDKSLASMPSAARASAEKAYGACLGLTACASFNSCIDGVMNGATTGTGGSSAGGTGGSSAGGTGGSSAGGTGGSSAGGTGGS